MQILHKKPCYFHLQEQHLRYEIMAFIDSMDDGGQITNDGGQYAYIRHLQK
ncbi:MAG: hypothetical protein MJY81_06420 [Bacteroidaceae bacterium]|nr:hypothetical protein [Bacteroidaceae bacterium]